MLGTRARAAVALLAAGLVVAGCGDGNPLELPAYDGSAAPAAPPTAGAAEVGTPSPIRVSRAATPPPQVTYRPADALGLGAWVERGRVRARTAAERAAVDVVERYLTLRVQLSNTWQVDEAELARVATGQALTSARERAVGQREQGLRTVGRFELNVSSVRVTGDRAEVVGCDFDATSEIDETGVTQVPPPGGGRFTLGLRRQSGTWLVADWPTKPVPYCDEWRR